MGKLERILPDDRLPIYVGAGVVKEKAQIEHLAPEEAIAAQILGSYTYEEHFGNDDNGRNNVFWWDGATQSAYNSIGLRNPGRRQAGEYLPEAIKRAKAAGQVILASVTTLKGENPREILPRMAQWALEQGADGVEFNGSCPNLDSTHPLLCNDVDEMGAVTELARERVGREAILGLKVSALPQETISRYYQRRLPLDFYDFINTIGNQPSPINPVTGWPAIEVNQGLAGLSGPAIRGIARENLLMWGQIFGFDRGPEDVDLLSIGGVESGLEVYDRVHHLGALMVGGAQAFYRARDPRQVAQKWAMGYADGPEYYE